MGADGIEGAIAAVEPAPVVPVVPAKPHEVAVRGDPEGSPAPADPATSRTAAEGGGPEAPSATAGPVTSRAGTECDESEVGPASLDAAPLGSTPVGSATSRVAAECDGPEADPAPVAPAASRVEAEGGGPEAAFAAVELASADPVLARARAVALLGSAADAETRSIAARAMALAAKELGDLGAAHERLREAIALAEDAGLELRAAQARLSLVAVLADRGRTAAAIAEADAVRASGVLSGGDLGRLLAQRAMALARDGRLHRALAAFDEAMPILRDCGDPRFIAGALSNRGLLLVHLGSPAEADAVLSESAAVADGAGLPLLAAMARHNLGCAALRAGDLPRALSMFDAAEPAFAGSGERACCLAVDRAEALLAAGLTASARDLLAGTVRRLGAFTADLAEARLLLARARLATGEAAEAVRDARAARDACRGRTGWAPLAAYIELEAQIAAIGGPEYAVGPARPAPGATDLEGAATAFATGAEGVLGAEHAVGTETGADPKRAAAPNNGAGHESVAGSESSADPEGTAGLGSRAGGWEAGVGRRLAARVQRCRRRLAQRGWVEAAARARILSGRLALAAGRMELARAELGAVAETRAEGPVQLRVAAWHAEALLRLADGRPAAAAGAALAGLRVVTAHARTLGATELRAHAGTEGRELAALGLRLAIRSDRPRAVLAWLERGRAVAAETRSLRPPHDPVLAADLAELRRISHDIAGVIAEGGDPAPLRATRLRLETTIRRHTHRTPAHTDEQTADQQGTDGRGADHPTADQPGLDQEAVERQGTDGREAGQPGVGQPSAGQPGVGQPGVGPRGADELRGGDWTGLVREVAVELGDRVLVEYGMLDGRLIAVVLDGGRCRWRSLGDHESVDSACATMRFALHRLAAGHGVTAARQALAYSAAELERLVIAPLGLHRDRELVIVPAGPLHALPWAALPSLTGCPLTVAPSATAWLRAARAPATDRLRAAHAPATDRLRTAHAPATDRLPAARAPATDRLRAGRAPATVDGLPSAAAPVTRGGGAGGSAWAGGRPVLVAGPRTAYAEEEIAALHRLYPDAVVLAGREATASAVRAALDGAGPVHIAGHGEFRAGSPLLSGVMLADGPLYGYELESLSVPPPRVVLSACDAGRAEVPGDGVPLGVAGGLLRSGVRSVIAGVTPVGDATTRRLMVALHERLIAGTPPAAALCGAFAATGSPEPALGFLCMGAS